MQEQVTHLLAMHMESIMTMGDQLAPHLTQVGLGLAKHLLSDKKILICAHGSSFANGLYFLYTLLHRYQADRPPFPAILLGGASSLFQTAPSEGQEDQIYAREVQALGNEQDVLFILSVSGRSAALKHVIHAAKEKQMTVILFMGASDTDLKESLSDTDTLLVLPSEIRPRILELQIVALHAVCEIIEQTIFNGHSSGRG